MELSARISQLKNAALKKIEEAAKSNDTKTIYTYTKTLEESERLKRKLDEISNALNSLEKNIKSISSLPEISSLSTFINNSITETKDEPSPREKGQIQRKKFIQELQMLGIHLSRRTGSIYMTKTQSLVGIAYASEQRPNRWFLGLSSNDYHSIVLLCENKDGQVVKFILPKNFYQPYEKNFSNVDGQLKFNILFRDDEYYMRIPRFGNFTLNQFINNYESINML